MKEGYAESISTYGPRTKQRFLYAKCNSVCASSACNWPLAQDVFKAGMKNVSLYGLGDCWEQLPWLDAGCTSKVDLLLTWSNPVCIVICVCPRGKFTFLFFWHFHFFFSINAMSGIYLVRKHCNLICVVGTGCSCAHQQAGGLGWSRPLSLHDLLVTVEINATVAVSLAVLFQLLVGFAVFSFIFFSPKC